jgi:hypothetical protein
MEEVKVIIIDVVKSPICVASEDGQILHNNIAEKIDAGIKVSISFAGVERITTAFLNAAIGQLYNEFEESKIRAYMAVVDATPRHLSLLKSVVDRAKEYFSDPEFYNNVTSSVLGDHDD